MRTLKGNGHTMPFTSCAYERRNSDQIDEKNIYSSRENYVINKRNKIILFFSVLYCTCSFNEKRKSN